MVFVVVGAGLTVWPLWEGVLRDYLGLCTNMALDKNRHVKLKWDAHFVRPKSGALKLWGTV